MEAVCRVGRPLGASESCCIVHTVAQCDTAGPDDFPRTPFPETVDQPVRLVLNGFQGCVHEGLATGISWVNWVASFAEPPVTVTFPVSCNSSV